MKIIFYLSVHTDKPKFVAILAPVAKQWIAKDIPSYNWANQNAKIAIHWFGKY